MAIRNVLYTDYVQVFTDRTEDPIAGCTHYAVVVPGHKVEINKQTRNILISSESMWKCRPK